jgi:hypothetical protein
MDIPHVSCGRIRSQADLQSVRGLDLDIAAFVRIGNYRGGRKQSLWMKRKCQDGKEGKKEQGIEPSNGS